jgi:hypothetical protein
MQDFLANGIQRMRAEAKATMQMVRDATGLSHIAELYADTVDLFGTESIELESAKVN